MITCLAAELGEGLRALEIEAVGHDSAGLFNCGDDGKDFYKIIIWARLHN